MVAVNSRTDNTCASAIFCSRSVKAVCAFVSRSLTRRFSSLFNARLRVRRLSA